MTEKNPISILFQADIDVEGSKSSIKSKVEQLAKAYPLHLEAKISSMDMKQFDELIKKMESIASSLSKISTDFISFGEKLFLEAKANNKEIAKQVKDLITSNDELMKKSHQMQMEAIRERIALETKGTKESEKLQLESLKRMEQEEKKRQTKLKQNRDGSVDTIVNYGDKYKNETKKNGQSTVTTINHEQVAKDIDKYNELIKKMSDKGIIDSSELKKLSLIINSINDQSEEFLLNLVRTFNEVEKLINKEKALTKQLELQEKYAERINKLKNLGNTTESGFDKKSQKSLESKISQLSKEGVSLESLKSIEREIDSLLNSIETKVRNKSLKKILNDEIKELVNLEKSGYLSKQDLQSVRVSASKSSITSPEFEAQYNDLMRKIKELKDISKIEVKVTSLNASKDLDKDLNFVKSLKDSYGNVTENQVKELEKLKSVILDNIKTLEDKANKNLKVTKSEEDAVKSLISDYKEMVSVIKQMEEIKAKQSSLNNQKIKSNEFQEAINKADGTTRGDLVDAKRTLAEKKAQEELELFRQERKEMLLQNTQSSLKKDLAKGIIDEKDYNRLLNNINSLDVKSSGFEEAIKRAIELKELLKQTASETKDVSSSIRNYNNSVEKEISKIISSFGDMSKFPEVEKHINSIKLRLEDLSKVNGYAPFEKTEAIEKSIKELNSLVSSSIKAQKELDSLNKALDEVKYSSTKKADKLSQKGANTSDVYDAVSGANVKSDKELLKLKREINEKLSEAKDKNDLINKQEDARIYIQKQLNKLVNEEVHDLEKVKTLESQIASLDTAKTAVEYNAKLQEVKRSLVEILEINNRLSLAKSLDKEFVKTKDVKANDKEYLDSLKKEIEDLKKRALNFNDKLLAQDVALLKQSVRSEVKGSSENIQKAVQQEKLNNLINGDRGLNIENNLVNKASQVQTEELLKRYYAIEEEIKNIALIEGKLDSQKLANLEKMKKEYNDIAQVILATDKKMNVVNKNNEILNSLGGDASKLQKYVDAINNATTKDSLSKAITEYVLKSEELIQKKKTSNLYDKDEVSLKERVSKISDKVLEQELGIERVQILQSISSLGQLETTIKYKAELDKINNTLKEAEKIESRTTELRKFQNSIRKELQKDMKRGNISKESYDELLREAKAIDIKSESYHRQLQDLKNLKEALKELAVMEKERNEYLKRVEKNFVTGMGMKADKYLKENPEYQSVKQEIDSIAEHIRVLSKGVGHMTKEEIEKIEQMAIKAKIRIEELIEKQRSADTIANTASRKQLETMRMGQVVHEFGQTNQDGKVVNQPSLLQNFTNDKFKDGEVIKQDFINRLRSANVAMSELDLKTIELKQDFRDIDNAVYKATIKIRENEHEVRTITYTYDKFTNKIYQTENAVKQVGRQLTALQQIGHALERVPIWGMANNLFFGITNQITQGFNALVEIDKAFINLAKVADESTSALREFRLEASEIAFTLGKSTAEVIEATSEFAKLGYNLQQSKKLAEESIIYSVVGDMDVQRASQAIVSTVKGFGLEVDKEGKQIQRIVDVFNEVGNNFAISSAGIGEALKRSSAVLHQAGNSLEESVALVTSANTTIQDPDRVGTALKTITMRLRGLDETGTHVKELVPQLENSFARFGMTIRKNGNEFKTTYEIMDELASKWKSLSDFQRAELTESIGGKHQGAIVSAMLQNWEDARSSLQYGMNSDGSAEREFLKTTEGMQFKIAQLTHAIEEFWMKAMNDEAIKSVITALTHLIELVTSLSENFSSWGVITVGLISLLSLFSSKARGLVKLFGDLQINGISMAFKKIKGSTSEATDAISDFSNNSSESLSRVERRAKGATLSIRGLGRAISTSLKGFGSFILGGLLGGVALTAIFSGIDWVVSKYFEAEKQKERLISSLEEDIQNLSEKQKSYNKLVDEGTISRLRELEDLATERTKESVKTKDLLAKSTEKVTKKEKENFDLTKLSTEERKEYFDITDKIADKFPDMVRGYTSEGQVIIKNSEALSDYIKLKKEELNLKQRILFNEKAEKFQDEFSSDFDNAKEDLRNEKKSVKRGENQVSIYNNLRAKVFEMKPLDPLKPDIIDSDGTKINKLLLEFKEKLNENELKVWEEISVSLIKGLQGKTSKDEIISELKKRELQSLTSVEGSKSKLEESKNKNNKVFSEFKYLMNLKKEELLGELELDPKTNDGLMVSKVIDILTKQTIEGKKKVDDVINYAKGEMNTSMKELMKVGSKYSDVFLSSFSSEDYEKAKAEIQEEINNRKFVIKRNEELLKTNNQSMDISYIKKRIEVNKGELESYNSLFKLLTETYKENNKFKKEVQDYKVKEAPQTARETSLTDYKDRIAILEELNNITKEVEENGKLSANSLASIAEKYPELLPYISNMKKLQKEIKKLYDSNAKDAKQSLRKNVENSEVFLVQMKNSYKDFFKEINKIYGVDLTNAKTIMEAKELLYSEHLKRLKKQYDGWITEQVDENGKFYLGIDWKNLEKEGKLDFNTKNPSDLALNAKKFENIQGILDEENKKLDETSKAWDKKVNDLLNKITKSLDLNPVDKSKSEKTKEFTYLTDKYKMALEQVNLELEKASKLKEREVKGSKDYQNYLQREIDLLKIKRDIINQQNAELKKQINSGVVQTKGKIVDTKNQPTTSNVSSSGSSQKLGGIWNNNITSGYGMRGNELHKGIDIGGKIGTPIYSNVKGTVFFAGFGQKGSGFGGYGNVVVIKVSNQKYTLYGHMNKIAVKKGQSVKVGTYLGEVGNTGASDGSHLHYEVRSNPTSPSSNTNPSSDVSLAKGMKVDSSVSSVSKVQATNNQNIDNAISQFTSNEIEKLNLTKQIEDKMMEKIEAEMYGKYDRDIERSKQSIEFRDLFSNVKYDTNTEAYRKYLDGTLAEYKYQMDKYRKELAEYEKLKGSKSLNKAQKEQVALKIREIKKLIIEAENATSETIAKKIDSTISESQERFEKSANDISKSQANMNLLKDTSASYRKEIDLQKKSVIEQMDIRSKEIAKLQQLIKTKNLTISKQKEYKKMIDEMRNELLSLQGTYQDLNEAIKDFNIRRFESFNKEYDDYFGKVNFNVEMIEKDMEFVKDGYDKYISYLSENKESDAKNYKEAYSKYLDLAKSEMANVKTLISSKNIYLTELKKKLSEAKDKELKETIQEKLNSTQLEVKDLELKLKGIIDSFDNITDSSKSKMESYVDDIIQMYKEFYEKKRDLELKEIDKAIEAEDKRHEKVLENIEKESQARREVFEEQMKMINRQNESEDYGSEINKKMKAKKELQDKINILSQDNSYEGIAKKKELQKDLDNLDEEIAKYQLDRSRKLREQELQDAYDKDVKVLESKKETEDKLNKQTKESLDKQKEAINKYYDNVIGNEIRWKDMRDKLLAGNLEAIEQMKIDFGDFTTYINSNLNEIGENIGLSFIDKLNEARNNLIKMKEVIAEINSSKINTDSVIPDSSVSIPNSNKMSEADYGLLFGKLISDVFSQQGRDGIEAGRIRADGSLLTALSNKNNVRLDSSKDYYQLFNSMSDLEKQNFSDFLSNGNFGFGSESDKKYFKEFTSKYQGLIDSYKQAKIDSNEYNGYLEYDKSLASFDGYDKASQNEKVKKIKEDYAKKPLMWNGKALDIWQVGSATLNKNTKIYNSKGEVVMDGIKGKTFRVYGYNDKLGYQLSTDRWIKPSDVSYKAVPKDLLNSLEVVKAKIQGFDTGGYTGDWSGSGGRLAYLHKKEIVLNEKQTPMIFELIKALPNISSILGVMNQIPKIQSNNTSNSSSYEVVINIENMNGTEKDVKHMIEQINKELMKKRGVR